MSRFQCVVFDMDGTLTQTNRLIFDAFNYIAEKHRGKRYTDPEIMAMFGPPEEGALLSIVGPEEIGNVMTDYLAYYRSHHKALARLHPGMQEVLEHLQSSGVHRALFTGKGTHTTAITLEEFGLTDLFELVVTGNDVREHKPSAEGIRKILGHFAIDPSETLMVGDAVSDVLAAREAGTPIAAVLWDSYAKDKVIGLNADWVFHTTEEFLSWVKSDFR